MGKGVPDWDCAVTLEGAFPTTYGFLSEFESQWFDEKAKMNMTPARIAIRIRLVALDYDHAVRQVLKVVDEAKSAQQVPADFDVMNVTVRSTA